MYGVSGTVKLSGQSGFPTSANNERQVKDMNMSHEAIPEIWEWAEYY